MLRDVVEEERFTTDIDAIAQKNGRIYEVRDAVAWALSRDPRLGTPIEQATDFRVYETTPSGDIPAYWILYTFDTQKVYLHSIQEVQDSISDE